jgi:hypothetical protein
MLDLSRLRRTLRSTLGIGDAGLKNESPSVLAVRNGADSDYGKLRTGTPVDANDCVPLSYLSASVRTPSPIVTPPTAADFPVTFAVNGAVSFDAYGCKLSAQPPAVTTFGLLFAGFAIPAGTWRRYFMLQPACNRQYFDFGIAIVNGAQTNLGGVGFHCNGSGQAWDVGTSNYGPLAPASVRVGYVLYEVRPRWAPCWAIEGDGTDNFTILTSDEPLDADSYYPVVGGPLTLGGPAAFAGVWMNGYCQGAPIPPQANTRVRHFGASPPQPT